MFETTTTVSAMQYCNMEWPSDSWLAEKSVARSAALLVELKAERLENSWAENLVEKLDESWAEQWAASSAERWVAQSVHPSAGDWASSKALLLVAETVGP
jgi:hypothetical protein